MPKGVLVVMTDCTEPGREEEFNEWYDEVHVPDVLEVPGIKGVTRYRLVEGGGDDQSRFLALYELDADDLGGVMNTLLEAVMSGRWTVSDTMDLTRVRSVIYEQISERVAAPLGQGA